MGWRPREAGARKHHVGERGEAQQLSPRRSFEAWRETVRGRSVPWTGPEIDAALAFAETLPDIRRARARDALAMLAMRDALTGLPNRALLLDLDPRRSRCSTFSADSAASVPSSIWTGSRL